MLKPSFGMDNSNPPTVARAPEVTEVEVHPDAATPFALVHPIEPLVTTLTTVTFPTISVVEPAGTTV